MSLTFSNDVVTCETVTSNYCLHTDTRLLCPLSVLDEFGFRLLIAYAALLDCV